MHFIVARTSPGEYRGENLAFQPRVMGPIGPPGDSTWFARRCINLCRLRRACEQESYLPKRRRTGPHYDGPDGSRWRAAAGGEKRKDQQRCDPERRQHRKLEKGVFTRSLKPRISSYRFARVAAFDPALEGRDVSSRGQRPRKTAHPTPYPLFPPPCRRGEGCRRWGEGLASRGFHPACRTIQGAPLRGTRNGQTSSSHTG